MLEKVKIFYIKIIDNFKIFTGLVIILNIIITKFKINFIISNVSKNSLDKLIKKLFIYDTGHSLIRLGSNKDGGYLVPDILGKIKYCFSPGVGPTTSFEKQLKKYNIISFLADGSVQDPSNKFIKYDFIKKNLNTFNDNKNITLKKWITNKLKSKKYYKLILQMDIEGSEIKVINHTSRDIIKKFKIMVIEFHYFQSLALEQGCKIYEKVFSKILKDFVICHIHPNNCCGFSKINQYEVPNVMEFTFINKELVKYKKKIKNKLPHKFDFKCTPNKEDIKLPIYFYKS
jgi:GTPase involved in cell partitioning and DNA repair